MLVVPLPLFIVVWAKISLGVFSVLTSAPVMLLTTEVLGSFLQVQKIAILFKNTQPCVQQV